MTAPTPRVVDMVFAAEAFANPPEPGAYLQSVSGRTAVSLSKVRRIIGDRSGPRYRLIGFRIRVADLPTGAVVIPWPVRPKLPSRAANAVMGPPPPVKARAKREVEKIEARRRVVTLLRDDRDGNRVVHKVRIDNETVFNGNWRDPDDLSPNRRSAKVIHGFRGRDCVQYLVDHNIISKSHAAAARRFRKEYELGEIGLRASRNLAEQPSGFSSGIGPSEARVRAMQTYRATAGALLPHMLDAIVAVAVFDQTIKDYAAARKMNNAQAASGYVLAALDLLRDHYRRIDDVAKNERQTIGPGLGPVAAGE